MDRIDKSESCANLVDLALRHLGAEAAWSSEGPTKIRLNDGTTEERLCTMLDARAFMRPMEASWDEILGHMAENLEEATFGAEGTEWMRGCFENDGNSAD